MGAVWDVGVGCGCVGWMGRWVGWGSCDWRLSQRLGSNSGCTTSPCQQVPTTSAIFLFLPLHCVTSQWDNHSNHVNNVAGKMVRFIKLLNPQHKQQKINFEMKGVYFITSWFLKLVCVIKTGTHASVFSDMKHARFVMHPRFRSRCVFCKARCHPLYFCRRYSSYCILTCP